MQNVNINQEVENAMMAPPQQPRGIVDLLASELKARDAKARNQLNTMMAPAPDPNTIISQNEKETENNVRQEITQKMQSMAVKENQNKARMNQALEGIAGQRANNMTRMANGGIIGYQEGGLMGPPEANMLQRMGQGLKNYGANAQESMGILKEAKAGMGLPYEERSAVMKQVRDEIEAQNQNRDPNFIERMGQKLMGVGLSVEESKAILKKFYDNMGKTYEQKASGMAMGGIVGYATGGEIEAYLDSIGADAKYKANLTPEQLAAIGEMLDSQATPQANKGVVERMAEVGRKMPGSNLGDRPARNAVVDMLDSPVARGQNEVLSALPSGAMGLLQDRMSELGPVSQGAAGANEEATERRRTGIAETLQNAMPEEGVVGRMAKVGRQMPGSNLGDRPVRNAMMEGIASLAPPKNPGATSEAARQFNRAAMQARNTQDPNTVSEFQQGLIDAGGANVTDQLNAAQRRINAENTTGVMDALSNTFSMPSEAEKANFRDMMGTGSRGQEKGITSGMDEQTMPAENKTGIMDALRNTFSGRSQEEIDYRERANQSIEQREFINEFAESDKFGAGLVRRIKENPGTAISTLMMAIPVGGWAGGLGVKALTKLVPYVVKHPMLASFLAGSAAKLPTPDIEKALTSIGLGEDLEEIKDTILTGLVGPDPLSGLESDEEATATDVITSTPAVSAEPAYDPMKGVEAVANPNLRRAIEATQTAPATGIAAPAAAEQEGEVAATQLASTVASNPTPENMSRFESEIQRLMEKRESPVRALSSFLKSFSQARGGSMGQNLAIATTAMNAADDAMDKQIIALEQLRRADQISERDFGLKQEQLTSQKGLLDAQASYYKNYKDMQVEIAELKEAGDTATANNRLYQSVYTAVNSNSAVYQMAAKAELGAKDMFSPKVRARANEMMSQAIETQVRAGQRFFDLPETDGSSPSSAVQEGATATNAQGDKVVFTNGAWTPM